MPSSHTVHSAVAYESDFRRTFPDETHALSRVSESTSDRHLTLGQPLSPASSFASTSGGPLGMTNSQSLSALSALSRKTSNAASHNGTALSGNGSSSGSALASVLKPPNPSLSVAINPRRLSQISDTSRASDTSTSRGNRASRLIPSFRRQTTDDTVRSVNGTLDGRDVEERNVPTPTPGIRVDRPSLDGARASYDADGAASVRTGLSEVSGQSVGGSTSGAFNASGSGGRLSQLFGGSRTPSARSAASASIGHVQSQVDTTTASLGTAEAADSGQLRPGSRGTAGSPLPSPPGSGFSDFGYLMPAINDAPASVNGSGSGGREAGSSLAVPQLERGQGQGSVRRKGVMGRLSTIMKR